MPPIEQIALILHEFSYAKARQNGSKLSDESRKVVGMIMANKDFNSIFPQDKLHLKRFWCGAGGGDGTGIDKPTFEIYGIPDKENQQNGIGLYFFGFSDMYVISQTRVYLPQVSLAELFYKEGQSFVHVPVQREFVIDETWFVDLETFGSDRIKIRAYKETEENTKPPWSTGFCRIEN